MTDDNQTGMLPIETELAEGEPQVMPSFMDDPRARDEDARLASVRALNRGDKLMLEGEEWRVMSNDAQFIRIKVGDGECNLRHADLAALIKRNAPKFEFVQVEKSAYEKLVEDVNRLRSERTEIESQLSDLTAEFNYADRRLADLEAMTQTADDAPREFERKQLVTTDAVNSPLHEQYAELRRQNWVKVYERVFPLVTDGVERIAHVILLERDLPPSGRRFVREAKADVHQQVWDLFSEDDESEGTLMTRIALTHEGRPSAFGRIPTQDELDTIAMQGVMQRMSEFELPAMPLDSQEMRTVSIPQEDQEEG